MPVGLGSYAQGDRRLDGRLAGAILSIQAQKAVEVGDGADGGPPPGSQVQDPIARVDGRLSRTSNHAGGVEGGISNGMPIVVRGTMKPIPTLIRPLGTVDLATGEAACRATSARTSRASRRRRRSPRPSWRGCSPRPLLERYGGDTFEALRERVEADRAAAL